MALEKNHEIRIAWRSSERHFGERVEIVIKRWRKKGRKKERRKGRKKEREKERKKERKMRGFRTGPF
ncbi:hypothetical protein WN48_02079 [Eufriesea mexicana]|nr:hypothetical protein WN48_02079 [Eufriesea mexicana]